MKVFVNTSVILLISLAVVVPNVPAQTQFPSEVASTSAGETSELDLYSQMTQIGTRARRTIRDRSGRVTREVFYTANPFETKTPGEKDLRVQSINVYFYDSAGRKDHIDHWEVGKLKPRVEQNFYDSSGELTRKWYVEPDGVRRYEMRFKALQTITHLYYDDTGSYLTSLRGQLVNDVDLPHGWGTTLGGMACGISLSKERGRLDQIGVWVNIKNVASEVVQINNLAEPLFELRDAGGSVISPRDGFTSQRKIELNQSQLYGQLLERDEAGYMYPAYMLGYYFKAVPPGKYTIRVRQSVPERNIELVSNEVTFVVL